MKPQSAKAKGRKAQQHVCKRLRDVFGLEEDDVQSRSMGASGEDVMLSPLARSHFPYSIEVKAQQRVNVWSSYDQAAENCKGHEPLLIIKRNRSKYLAVLELDAFLELVRKANGRT